MTDHDTVARLREVWRAGAPRLSPTSNMILAFVNSRPQGTRAADVLPLLLDDGEPMPDRDSDRWVRLASKGKVYLRRLASAGRLRCVSVGLYAPQVMTLADSANGHDSPDQAAVTESRDSESANSEGTPAPHDDPRHHGQVMEPTVMEDPETGNGHDGTAPEPGREGTAGTGDAHGNPVPHGDPMHATVMTDPVSGDGHDSDTEDDPAGWLLDLAQYDDQPTGD